MSYISAIRRDNDVLVWERNNGVRETKTFPAPYFFYIPSSDGEYQSIYGDRLTKYSFDSYYELNQGKIKCQSHNIQTYESDIPPELKVLSEKYYNATIPLLHITFFDIEVDYNKDIGFASADNPYAPINSVALYHTHLNKYVILAVPPETEPNLGEGNSVKFEQRVNDQATLPNNTEIILCRDERDLLLQLLVEIEDSDVISGWNSDFFDVPYVGKRLEKLGKKFFRKLSFPEGDNPKWREVEVFGNVNQTLDLSGRISADYMVLFRKYEMSERQSYKLESVADDFLPDLPKMEYEGSLANLYRENFAKFIRYNIRDTEILHGLESLLGYVDLANQMYHLSTGIWKHVSGTLKLAELATVNYCHHELDQLIVNDINPSDESASIQGAFVLEPKVGMHENIGSVDIKSLYPSSIRSLNISPETLIGQFTLNSAAAEKIANNETDNLILEYDSGEHESMSAAEWRAILAERKWAVSGYGTVFSQATTGIIPDILSKWYATRKEYQRLAAEADKDGDDAKATYYDKLQYVYKIRLNSFYGALTNQYFRFYDLRMGESTTGTGRMILKHQCAKANEIMTGTYNDNGEAVIYGDSVSGDTHIYTDRGTFRIEDLFIEANRSSSNGKEYCDIHNVKTLTYNPKTRTNEFRQLKYVMRHKVNKAMYRVWIGNTRYVDVTEDHSLIGYANTRHKTPGLIEVKPTDIGKNHVNGLLINRYIPRVNVVYAEEISNEMFMLMGLIIGDGHIEKNMESGVGLSLGSTDKQEILNKVIDPLINQQWFTSAVNMKNGHDIRLCGTKGWYFLREHLYPHDSKEIPKWLYDCSEQKICAFLKGYFTADGFANTNKTIGLCSTQLNNIVCTNNLLKLCGIPSNYWVETTENSYKGKYSGTHTARLTVYDAVAFGNNIGFVLDRKNQNIRTTYGTQTKHLTTQSGYCVVHPTKIEEIVTPKYVYDIEVDDTHTFYANDILVHNTDSTYFETWTNDPADTIKIADRVGELITESFPEYMRTTFLCQPGFDGIIETDREIVSDRGIFVDKKRYILHMIDKEGKPVDKMKVMGLDTKKTTMPKHVSDKLNHFIERHLKGETWENIAEDIVQYKEHLEQTDDIMSIGLPKGVKKVEHYTKEYQLHGTGARLPGHIAASILYNICRDHFNDKESMPIHSGMKIKVFYLNHKVDRFKSIAIPVDIEQIPDWFEDFSVDRKAHIERLVDKPLQNIIKAIDKDVPTRQSLLVESALEF